MKQSKRMKIGSIVVLTLAMATGTSGCFLTQKASNTSLSSSASSAGVYQGVGTVGVLNVNQLLSAMTNVTGLSPMTTVAASGGGTQTLATSYTNISPFIPASGFVSQVNAATLLAITGFAGSVCSAWLVNEATAEIARAGSSMANSGVKFNSGPAGITPAIAAALVNNYSMHFWGRLPTATEATVLNDAIISAAAAVTATGSQGTQQVLLVPCTAMMASPAFLAS